MTEQPAGSGAGSEDEAGMESLDELLAQIPELGDRLSTTEDTVGALVEELTDYPAGGPWLWDGLSAERQRELWTELDQFVTWLQNRILCHSMNKEDWIPACWYRHPDAVEQLTALMVAHKASYHPKTKKASHALVDWFHRALWPTMDTLKQRRTLKSCLEKGTHQEQYMTGVQLTAESEDFATFLDDSVPAPTEAEAPAFVDPATGEITEPEPTEPPHEANGGDHA